jgi:predicted AlkP superfamily phosphohydrolase/phosphomutase
VKTGEALSEAVRTRALAAEWLLRDRLPDWQLGIVVVSESHSAIEPLWHGVDPTHPLHVLPSAPAAGEALRKVYEAIDRLVGDLVAAFPDTTVVAFAMHGMGTNDADLPAMALVPELLYRHAFGRPYAKTRAWASELPGGAPVLAPDEGWDKVMAGVVPWPPQPGLGNRLRRLVGKANKPGWAKSSDLGWMPATRYYAFWPDMPAFALPAYYDSQIRLNLEGREARGKVPLARYEAARQEIVALLEECRDAATGETAVAAIHLHDRAPLEMGPTEADIYVSFRPGLCALDHPRTGRIGPYPFRRTGGHSGPWGFLWAAGEGIAPGVRGGASSFDVAPTILDWLDQKRPAVLSGASLLSRIRAGARAIPAA